MRNILLGCFLCLSIGSIGQTLVINGPNPATPGSEQTYYTTIPNYDWDRSLSEWYVTGGTIVSYDEFSCTVLWNNSNGTGMVSVNENYTGQYGILYVQIGEVVPTIMPESQNAFYG